MSLREEFRTVIVRERSGPWWRRYRWAIEKLYVDEWRLKETGYTLTWRAAVRDSFCWAHPVSARFARVELATHFEHEPYEITPPERTPLPPQLIQPTPPEGSG